MELTYSDYCWSEDGSSFRQRDLVVTQVYDPEYLQSRYVAIDHAVKILAYRRLAILEAFLPRIQTLLDFGCGTNHVARAGVMRGWSAFGYDIVPGIATGSGDRPRLAWDEACARTWDVVTFFDSLEHLVDPAGVVRCLDARAVFVSVPWCHYPDDPEWFMGWRHRRPGEHLHHWNPDALDRFFASLGYEPLMRSCFEDDFRERYDPHLPNILTALYRRS